MNSELKNMVQVNHRIPKWAKQMVYILAQNRNISEEQWWDEAFRLKLEQDYNDVEAVFGLAKDFVSEQRRRKEFNSPDNGDQ